MRQHQYYAVVIHLELVAVLFSSVMPLLSPSVVVFTINSSYSLSHTDRFQSSGTKSSLWFDRSLMKTMSDITVITLRLSFVSFLTPAGTIVADEALPTIASSCKQAGH